MRVQIRSREGAAQAARSSARRALNPLRGLMIAAALAIGSCGPDHPPGTLPVARVLGETGTHPGQFRYPRGMDAFNLEGNPTLAIVDKTARIQLIDLSTGHEVGSLRTPESDLGMPTGLTIAHFPGEPDTPAIWVADTHEHRILVYRLPFDHDGAPTPPDLLFGTYGYEDGSFVYPTDIAVEPQQPDGSTRVYVSEYGGNDRVSLFRFAPNETTPDFVRQIGFSGVAMDAPEDDPGALSRPQSITLRSQARELVVVDAGRHRVVRFDILTGEPIAWTFGETDSRGEPTEPMRFPYGLALLDDRHALVTEFGASALRVLDLETGRTVTTIGGPGREVGMLATPWSAMVVGDELVVLDSGNDRVQVARWEGVAR